MKDTALPARQATPVRTLFLGTAPLACPALAALAKSPAVRLLAAITQPDRPQGRNLRRQPPPVKVLAQELGLDILQPERIRLDSVVAELRHRAPDLIVVAAYGQILPRAVLDIPVHGCLNIHASLLPRYRGAAPIQWAMLNGDVETGVTLMKIDEGLDTGDILVQERTAIHPEDTAQTLHDRLAEMGGRLLVESLPAYLSGSMPLQPQPEVGVSYAPKITKADGKIQWAEPALRLKNQIRALTPWPGAFTHWPEGSTASLLKIWRAEVDQTPSQEPPGTVLSGDPRTLIVACGDGALRIVELQLQGGRRLQTETFLTGHPVPPGTRFS